MKMVIMETEYSPVYEVVPYDEARDLGYDEDDVIEVPRDIVVACLDWQAEYLHLNAILGALVATARAAR